MTQGDTFIKGEADHYYERNADHLAKYQAGNDPVARAISTLAIQPKRIVDFGCSSGERLRSLVEHYNADGVGIDPSSTAIQRSREIGGRQAWVNGTIDSFEYDRFGTFDLVICSFVLHWVDRSKLLQSLAVLEASLTPNGYIVIFDFHTLVPHKRAYHHAPGVWTYKCDYPKMLEATGCFEIRYRKVLTYPGYQVPAVDETGDLSAVTVLQRVQGERMLTA